jgi:hypothetical protein
MAAVQEMVVSHGQSICLENVPSKHRASSIEKMLVSAIGKTQLNFVAAAYNVCTILDTVAKLTFCIVLRGVLCCAV